MDQRETGRLLVVDDNEMNRDLLSRRLARRGHEVAVAAGGEEALEMIRKQRFDLILLDIMMPGIDGMEVLRRLRETYAPRELPIIMATAKDESEDVVAALKAGANDYVTKPLDFPVVRARVQTQLQLKQASDELARAYQRMKRDLDTAAGLQHALLPPADLEIPGVTAAWRYRPCEVLAGDALSVFEIDPRYVGLWLLDVAGHGVPAALLSVAAARELSTPRGARSVLATRSDGGGMEPAGPAVVARRLNERFPMSVDGRSFLTLFYGVLDRQSGELRFVCCGHPGPTLVRAGGEATSLDSPSLPIGVLEGTSYEEREVTLAPGDRLYVYSDGLHEQLAAAGKQHFGRDRINADLTNLRHGSLGDSLDQMMSELLDWAGGPALDDDVSMLAIEMPRSEVA